MWCKILTGIVIPLVLVILYNFYYALLESIQKDTSIKRIQLCQNYKKEGKDGQEHITMEIAIECDYILMSNNSEYNVLYDCFKRSFELDEFPKTAQQYMDLFCGEENEMKQKINDECVQEVWSDRGIGFNEKFLSDTNKCMEERVEIRQKDKLREAILDPKERARLEVAIDADLEEIINQRIQSGLQSEIEAQLTKIRDDFKKLKPHLDARGTEEDDEVQDEEDDDPEGIWKD